jgi:hypothetical protein
MLQRLAGNRAVAQLLGREPTAARGDVPARPAGGPMAAAAPTVLVSNKFSPHDRLQRAANNHPALKRREPVSVAVKAVQEALVEIGYPMPNSTLPGDGLDGNYGRETVQTVKVFQAQNGLEPIDGKAGRKTLGLLDAMMVAREVGGATGGGGSGGGTTGPSRETLVAHANTTRRAALGAAVPRLTAYLASLQAIAEAGAGVYSIDQGAEKAVTRWLEMKTDHPKYQAFVEQAIGVLSANYTLTAPTTIDEGECQANAAAAGGPGYAWAPSKAGGVLYCNSFFSQQPSCRGEIAAHEHNHLLSLGHHYAAKTPEDAIKCAHHMTELAFELAGMSTSNCSGPIDTVIAPIP